MEAMDEEHYISVCHGSQFLDSFGDNDFFPACFPTLFPYGKGGPRPTHHESGGGKNFNMREWAGNLLQRHGGRFARHPIFSFLVFDIEARLTNARVASARVESARYDQVCEAVQKLDKETLTKAAEDLKKNVARPTMPMSIAS